MSFIQIGLISVFAIFAGLSGRGFLGEALGNVIFFGGVIVGCLNLVYFGMLKYLITHFQKKDGE